MLNMLTWGSYGVSKKEILLGPLYYSKEHTAWLLPALPIKVYASDPQDWFSSLSNEQLTICTYLEWISRNSNNRGLSSLLQSKGILPLLIISGSTLLIILGCEVRWGLNFDFRTRGLIESYLFFLITLHVNGVVFLERNRKTILPSKTLGAYKRCFQHSQRLALQDAQ